MTKVVRAFISIELPDEIKEQIDPLVTDLREQDLFKGTFTSKNKYHVTLRFLGEINDQQVDAVKKTLHDLQFDAFDISLKGMGTFPSKDYIKVVWVGADIGASETTKLQKELDERLAKVGFQKQKQFHPHVTVARVNKVYQEYKPSLLEFIDLHADIEFGSFEVQKLYLMKSTLTPSGAIYEEL